MREDAVVSGAILSPCSRYRYRLWREWCPTLPTGVFVMLNPSTADASVDDPTIRRCMQFARAWGWGRIEVVNVFAFRTAYPQALVQAHRGGLDVVGPERDTGLSVAFDRARVVVAAWGANKLAHEHARGVLSLVPPGLEITCLGKTQGGFPRHPLYMRGDTPLSTFSMESL